ncbi:MAG: acyl-CoA dehydrogenase [Candidatus Marinimicrobia bacterium]|nr:acyl-CoA dehydrogenase [Candidatus Neomarinimicrobiota bacterium]
MQFLLTEDQRKLQDTVHDFAQAKIAPVAEQLDKDAKFPTVLFHELSELGLTSIPFEEKWGGMGLGTFETALALEQVARADQSLAVGTMVSISTGLTLARFGSEEQKEKYLPDIVSGKKICSIAGTEPQAGSDTAGLTTSARLDGNIWRMNGEKAWITNSGTDISSFALVLAVTSPVEAPKKSFTLFLVPVGTKGYTVGKSYDKMGWRSSDTHPLHFDDCELSPDHIVGELDKGRLLLHKGYQQARVFLATCSLGLAQGCLDHAVSYAKERKAFGGTLGGLQMIQKMIADIAVKVETARLVVYKAAWMTDKGLASLKDLSVAKYYATEIATECANLALQVHGGWGFMDDCPVSRYLRDNRICTIGDGSSQIQAMIIARDLGLEVSFT